AGSLTSCSRPYRSMVSATSTSNACGTGYREYRSNASTTDSASCPAARAFHSPSGVNRYVCTCSGERSSSANGAIAIRHAGASGWSTSSRSVLSDCTISGPPLPSSPSPPDRPTLQSDTRAEPSYPSILELWLEQIGRFSANGQPQLQ